MEQVILVNENDQEVGFMEKMEAHEKALLHRAFSVFVFNKNGELLLQQRASTKYHSGGLWTNTCCSHPRPGESLKQATSRRLMEEMGMKTKLEHQFHFIYKAELDSGLTEHEVDHVFIGFSEDHPIINPEEVQDWKYASLESIKDEMTVNPDHFTVWFQVIFERVQDKLLEILKQESRP